MLLWPVYGLLISSKTTNQYHPTVNPLWTKYHSAYDYINTYLLYVHLRVLDKTQELLDTDQAQFLAYSLNQVFGTQYQLLQRLQFISVLKTLTSCLVCHALYLDKCWYLHGSNYLSRHYWPLPPILVPIAIFCLTLSHHSRFLFPCFEQESFVCLKVSFLTKILMKMI